MNGSKFEMNTPYGLLNVFNRISQEGIYPV
jgi:hypothetical protein